MLEKERLAKRIGLYWGNDKRAKNLMKDVRNGLLSLEELRRIYEYVVDEFETEVLEERKEIERRREEALKKPRGYRMWRGSLIEGKHSNGWYILKDLGNRRFLVICPTCNQQVEKVVTTKTVESKRCKQCYNKELAEKQRRRLTKIRKRDF